MHTPRVTALLLVLFILLGVNSQAQITRIDTVSSTGINLKVAKSETQSLYMYSIGVKAFSMEEFPKILNEVDADKFTKTYMSGVFLKINDNQISYRLGAAFYNENISFKNECKECEDANGRLSDFSTRLGFEKNFIYGSIQPYLAFDIGYRRNSFKGEVKNATIVNYTDPYSVNTLKNGFLMTPGFGVKLNFLQHLTIAAETGVGLLYSYEKQEKTFKGANDTRTRNIEKYNKWEFLLNPLSMISLQYNFGLSY